MDDRNPTDLAGQQRAAKDQARREKVARDAELADLHWLMSDARGRRFMWGLLDKAGVFRSSFTGNSTTFFNEGQRNIGLMMISQIHEKCPELYTAMVNEAADERKARNAT
jgi:hypothetical protein